MRQILSRSLLTVAAASSVLAVTGGYAHADSDVHGGAQGSPGVLAGNSVEIPLNAPVNACGNTAGPVSVLNPAFGNSCANVSGPVASSVSAPQQQPQQPHQSDQQQHQPQFHPRPQQQPKPAPEHQQSVPPQVHREPSTGGQAAPAPAAHQVAPPVVAHALVDHVASSSGGLAETGMSGGQLGAAVGTSAALLLGGAMLYRRAARTSRIQRTYG